MQAHTQIRSEISHPEARAVPRGRTWLMAILAGIGLYVVIDIVLALLRPDYSWLHNAESDYGRGPYFWLMDANFILRCLFSLALAKLLLLHFPKGHPVRQVAYWVGAWAIASGLLAFFADNPYGYPKLASGSIHLALAFIAFITALIALFITSRHFALVDISARATILVKILAALALLSLLALGRSGFRSHGFGGLYERIFLACVLVWEAILAFSLTRRSPN